MSGIQSRIVGATREADTMKRTRRIGALGILGGIMVLTVATAAPASAEVIQGPCTGFADFSNGASAEHGTPLSEVVEVPEKDDAVSYFGDTHLSEPPDPEPFSGYVAVRLPIGGSWEVVNWPVPPGETEATFADGLYAYEVPGFVPRGTGGLEVTAFHTQRGQVCEVAVTLSLAGSPGAPAIIGTAGTAVFGAGVLMSGRRRVV